jgi:SPP1 family predicted phage head-tail adaptor
MRTIMQGNSPVLQSGKLRHRIMVVSPSTSFDSMGGPIAGDSTTVGTFWASIEALTGTEKFAAHEFVSQVSHSIVLRYQPGITFLAKMIVWYNGRTFQVESILNPDERNKIIQLLCIEINNSTQQPPTPSE